MRVGHGSWSWELVMGTGCESCSFELVVRFLLSVGDESWSGGLVMRVGIES